MSKTVNLNPEDTQAMCTLTRQVIEKYHNGMSRIRTIIAGMDQSLDGGQGNVIKGVLSDMSQGLSKLQTKIAGLQQKLVEKERTIEETEKGGAIHAASEDIVASVLAQLPS